uniref:ATP-binding protein n=1 Tax=Roseobacter sp. TaxID=1907202 RepID=UPI0025F8BC7C
MKAEPEEYHKLRDALFLQAALVEEFNPRDMLSTVIPAERSGDILLRGKLMSALREASTGDGSRWQMRPVQRRKILGRLESAQVDADSDIGAALKGNGAFSAEALVQVSQPGTASGDLAHVVSTLEQAGPAAPGHGRLLELSSRLDHLRREHATDVLLGSSFVGREEEIARLLHALDHPQRTAPLKTLHIQGLPGVGKTFLLEHLGRLCRDRPRVVMIRLDFDRSSLREGAVDAVFEEISRQIGAAIPSVAGLLHDLRMQRAERRTSIASETGARLPSDLLHGMIGILADHDRQVLFLLDTLEVLHGYGATFVHQLFREIDRFADKERIDISLISAGRGPVFARDDARLQDFIALEALDDKVTAAILEKRNVPAHLRDRIVSLS